MPPSAPSGNTLKEAWTEIREGSVWEYYDKEGTPLGEGMTGAVYSLTNKITGDRYAGKSVSKASIDEALLDDLRQEITVLKQMDHPNVVKLYEVYESQTEIYLVMELCTGGELYDALIGKEKYGENDAAVIFYQMVAAVNYVHSMNLAHRDLKLENFIFEDKKPDSHLKLIDFGLSHTAKNGIHRMKSVVGTPYYIAPEVLKSDSNSANGPTYTEKCDIWSLGVLLYMLLSGSPPFAGNSDNDIMHAVLRGQVNLTERVWNNVSSEAKELVRMCLEVNPTKRATASEVLKSPWFDRRHRAGKEDDNTKALSGVAGSLKNFGGMSKLKKTVVNLVAFTMTPDKIKEMKTAFMACDADGNGVLTLDEFRKGMEGFIPADQIDTVFESIDTDGGGTIEYSEFLAAAVSKEQYQRTDKIKAAWNRLDADNSGYLDHEDFRILCKDMYTEEEMQEIILEADPDKDGKIFWEEFLKIMKTD